MSTKNWLIALLAALSLPSGPVQADTVIAHEGRQFIVESSSGGSHAALLAVRRVGGVVTRELPIISGVSARLSPAQETRLGRYRGITMFPDSAVVTQGTPTTSNPTIPDVYQRAMLGVNTLASQGFNGAGVTVAIVDSGILHPYQNSALTVDLNHNYRLSAQYDAGQDLVIDAAHPCAHNNCANDGWGHGSHIAGLIASSDVADSYLNGEPQGIAPMVKLVNVKAFNDTGAGSHSTVLAGLNWILANRTTYGSIRVVNLSFGAPPRSFYWNDPIDQAVMKQLSLELAEGSFNRVTVDGDT